MADTYKTAADASADRAAQQALLAALTAWDRALRRDECGAWRISGRSGHIYADDAGWLLYVACRSSRAWTEAKKRLTFCEVTQDGDHEGCLRLVGLPTPEQAAVIRSVVGINKRREYDPATVISFVERLRNSRDNRVSSASDGRPATSGAA